LSIDKKCSRLYTSPKPNEFKKVIEVFATNKQGSLPNRNNLLQKQYTPHSIFEYNNQDLKILSPFLSVFQNHFFWRLLRKFFVLSPTGGATKRTFVLALLWLIQLSTYDLSRSHQAERFSLEDDVFSAFVPHLPRCIIYFRVSHTGPSAPLGVTERFSGGHEQRLSLGSLAVILHKPSVTIASLATLVIASGGTFQGAAKSSHLL